MWFLFYLKKHPQNCQFFDSELFIKDPKPMVVKKSNTHPTLVLSIVKHKMNT
jgi:hypothetical protein